MILISYIPNHPPYPPVLHTLGVGKDLPDSPLGPLDLNFEDRRPILAGHRVEIPVSKLMVKIAPQLPRRGACGLDVNLAAIGI